VLPTDDPLFWTSAASCAPVLQLIGTKDATGRNNFFVTAALDKSRSWVRASVLARSDQVLAHEQVHFDICELIARRLRQRIAQVYEAGGDVFTLPSGKSCSSSWTSKPAGTRATTKKRRTVCSATSSSSGNSCSRGSWLS
jgi:hypothetical protein